MIEPYVSQILPDEMPRRDLPSFELGRRGNDAVPPEERNRIGFGQRMPLELATAHIVSSAHSPTPGSET